MPRTLSRRPNTIKDGTTYNLPDIMPSNRGTNDPHRPRAARDMQLIVNESRVNGVVNPLRFRENLLGLFGIRESVDSKRPGQVTTRLDLKAAKTGADELPLREVAQFFLGADFMAGLANPKTARYYGQQLARAMSGGIIGLHESAAPVTSSTQQSVNLFSIFVGGLFEAAFKEGYEMPEFISEQMIQSVPTMMREQRIIGELPMSLPDRPTHEALEYPNAGVYEQWVLRPPVMKMAQKCSLTREALIYGLGGQLMEAVQKGGEALAYLKDYLVGATLFGLDIPAGTPGFMDGYNTAQYWY